MTNNTNTNANATMYINVEIDVHSTQWEDHWTLFFKIEGEEQHWLDNEPHGYAEGLTVFTGTKEECARVMEYCSKSFPEEGRATYALTGDEIYWKLLEEFRPEEYRRAQEIHSR